MTAIDNYLATSAALQPNGKFVPALTEQHCEQPCQATIVRAPGSARSVISVFSPM